MKSIDYNSKIPVFIVGIGLLISIGCKKLVQADLPIDKETAKSVYSSSSGASAILSNIYYSLYGSGIAGGAEGSSVINGLNADEFVLHDENNMVLQTMYSNSLSTQQFRLSSFWKTFYELIFRINSIIEGVESSKEITPASKSEIIGQAKFLRAFAYFYLVNLYGGVPIVTSTDYKVNSFLPRSQESEVYAQIIQDLTEAQNMVSANYLRPDLITTTTERVTANKAVVTALLARVYLYTNQWQKADIEATKVINNSEYSILTSLNEVFLKNSKEAIFQIEGDVFVGNNAADGAFFIPTDSFAIPQVYLSDHLMNVIDANDQRRYDWLATVVIDNNAYYYPYKYKQNSNATVTKEYNMILRLGEQYLIRSEARAHLNNLDGALEDLNVIRHRAKVSLFTSIDQAALFQAIEKERQIELFSEFGHRWFDLKRTKKADTVLGAIKGSDWQPSDKLFPIPSSEFLNNPSLRGHQNPGYSEE